MIFSEKRLTNTAKCDILYKSSWVRRKNSLKEVQKKFFWEIWKKDLTNTKKCDIINKSLNNRWQNEILGCRQVVRQRTLTPLFRGFKSFHPNQMKTRCNASGFLFFKHSIVMLVLVYVKWNMKKKKRIRKRSADTLFVLTIRFVLVASTRTCREVQLERVILLDCPITLLVDI